MRNLKPWGTQLFHGSQQTLFKIPVNLCTVAIAVALATGNAQAASNQALSYYGPGTYTVPYLIAQPGTTTVDGGAVFNFSPASAGGGNPAGFNVKTALDTDPLVKLVLDYSSGTSANSRITINDVASSNFSHGIVVGRDGYLSTTPIANMVLEAKGVDITLTGPASATGLLLQGGSATFDNGSITTTANKSNGIQSSFGGRASLTDSTVTTHGSNATGLMVAGGGRLDMLRGSVEALGQEANAVQVQDDSLVNLTDTDLTVADTADMGWGLYAKTKSHANFTGGHIVTRGDASEAVVANNATLTLQNATVNTEGVDSYALYAYDQGQITVSDSDIGTLGDNSGGGRTVNGGNISLTDVEVNTAGSHSNGLLMVDGGAATLTNTKIHTTGADASGIAATVSHAPTAQNTAVVDSGSINSAQAGVVLSEGARLDVSFKNGAQATGNGLLAEAKTDQGNNALINITADSHAILTGDIRADTGSIINLDLSDDAELTGAAQNGHDFTIGHAGLWNITADSSVHSLSNSGSIHFNAPGHGAFKTLTVQGDYIGNNGLLQINTQLGDDSALTDKLVVNGNVSGKTDIVVNSAGSQGASTTKGILLVDVPTGTSTRDAFRLSSQSTGYRSSTATISSGGFDYHLARGGNGGTANSWYLNSHSTIPASLLTPAKQVIPASLLTPAKQVIPASLLTPAKQVIPASLLTPAKQTIPASELTPAEQDIPATELTTEEPVTPGMPSEGGLQVSPEVGSWLGNRYAAETMFAHTYHERKHDAVTYAGNNDVWLRAKGGRSRDTAGDGNVVFRTNTALTQLGMDFLDYSAGTQNIKAGAMLGFGTSDTHASSDLINSETLKSVNVKAKGATYGKSLGAYLSWVQDATSGKGAYVDLTVSNGWYNNTLKSEIGSATYDSRVVSASVESGYAWPLLPGRNLYIEPQAQVIFSHYDSDTVTLSGSRYQSQNNNSYTSRIGTRVYVSGNSIKPYIETSYVHSTTNDALMTNGNTFSSSKTQVAEIRAGVSGAVNNKFKVYGEVISQIPVGPSEQHYTGGQVGLKYSF